MKGIHVLGNQFRGADVRPLVVDTQGRKLDLPPEAVKVENNEVSAEPRRRS